MTQEEHVNDPSSTPAAPAVAPLPVATGNFGGRTTTTGGGAATSDGTQETPSKKLKTGMKRDEQAIVTALEPVRLLERLCWFIATVQRKHE
jgi:hypothetical protein